MYYMDVLRALYSDDVRYLIVGGLAVNLYGIPRVTQDIDVVISTDRDNVARIARVLAELEYVPRLPVDPMELAEKEKVTDWIQNRNLKAFSFYHRKDPYKVFDILLDHPLDFNSAYEKKTVKNIEDIEVYLVSVDDLILMKRKSGRPQDTSDIDMLNRLRTFMEE